MTREEAVIAIRQHPELAAEMAPSKTEIEIINMGSVVTTAMLKGYSKENASRFMAKLIRKGYFKRASWGVYERL